MGFASFARRMRFPLFVASLLAATLTVFGPAPQEALAEPRCTAFANTPALVAGQVEANGGATCTSAGTVGFRVDVRLYRDGVEVDWAVNTCHGEQQCGTLVRAADEEGDQQWCAETVAALTGSMTGQSGQAPRTEMICEHEAF